MEAKDTVMDLEKAWVVMNTEEDGSPIVKALEAQAEISFKAGREQEHKAMIAVAVNEGNKAYEAGYEQALKDNGIK